MDKLRNHFGDCKGFDSGNSYKEFIQKMEDGCNHQEVLQQVANIYDRKLTPKLKKL